MYEVKRIRRFLANAVYLKKYMILQRRLDTSTAESLSADIPGMTSAVIEKKDDFTAYEQRGFDMNICPCREYVANGLKSGAGIYAVFSGPELVHASWFFRDRESVPIDGIFRKYDFQGAGFIGPCYTKDTYRGKGIYPSALGRIADILKRENRSRVLIVTSMKNMSSMKGIVKAGFKPFREYICLKVVLDEFYFLGRPIAGQEGYGI
jgi:hypothetical protein